MLPSRLLIHQVTITSPAETTDAYGNTVYDYAAGTTRTVCGWMQQDARAEQFSDGRAADTAQWLLMTNVADIGDKARVQWTAPQGAMTFELDGPPASVYAGLARAFHHSEVSLRRIEG